ncbi:MAG: hypothetical protein WA943_05185 [Parvibaculum sp.]|uniref:hypothetical protein n=1 Tax=Parvibaculum sp. TaxID=2024848 RepID=UPI003C78FBF8
MDRTAPSKLAILAIGLLGVINLARGSIHFFAPDGGLTSIAGLDLSTARQTIVFFIAAVGAGQITLGILDLYVIARHRAMVRPLLVIHLVGMALGLFLFLVWKPLPVVVPGQYGAVFSFLLLSVITAREFWLWKRNGAD